MQTTENEEQQPIAPADPQSQPVVHIPLAQDDQSDDESKRLPPAEADDFFANAVAEIDTQPLQRKREPFTFGEVLEVGLLVGVLLLSFMGILWQCITYPHTLVILYTTARPAHITTTLDVPTRSLAPVTITHSATIPTTGTGHQEARAATGTLLFYNGSATPQSLSIGSVFTGNDGVKVTIDQSITVPAADLPAIGSVPVFAHAVLAGSQGNIAAFDINLALSPVLKVRNEAPFSNGRDARTYRAVAAQDLQTLTTTVNATVTQAFTTAFPLQPGEEALPTTCTTKAIPNHQRGEEAQSVMLTTSKSCSAVAYNSQEVEQLATTAFTKTRPAATYHLVGSIQTSVQSVAPLSVTISGKWAYTFTPDDEQLLAKQIVGDTPDQARKVLLRTGEISFASIPSTLPPAAMYINFLVLVG